jgi:uncharacterized protein with von Willebrand factor type A (vWA) domain
VPPGDAGRMVVGFARALRAAGLAVPVDSVVVCTTALAAVGLAERAPAYWAARATLVHRPEDVALFDRVFAAYWHARPLVAAPPEPVTAVAVAVDDGPDDPLGGDMSRPADIALRWSTVERLGERDFAAYGESDWADLERLLGRLRLTVEVRPARRRRPDRHRRGDRPDLRRTVRRALRTGGEPIDRAWQRTTTRPRRIVLLVDVSGSMEPYARALLRFAHAAVSARGVGGAEVFTLGTRLTRVTRELGNRDPDAALRAASTVVADWSGGTRLGAGLEEFNRRWGTAGTARGAVVVILSDGWDRGDPDELAEQMARLGRVAHRIVWVNPLKASPGYAPLARGMAAALPYVDEFVEGHTSAALEHLADVVAGRVGTVGHRGERGTRP